MFCPTFEIDGVPQIEAKTTASLTGLLAPDGVEVETLIGMDNPYPGGRHRNTLHQYQGARKFFLSGGYDALLTVDHDMIVPPDALIKLWETDAQVVYALYVFRHGAQICNVMTLTPGSVNIGESISLLSAAERGQLMKQTTMPCSGIGFGCTLIRREVLERFDFHDSTGNPAPDMGLATDCLRAGIKQIARFDVICGHIDSDSNRVLWPGKGEMTTIKCKILTNFVGSISGRGSIRFSAGEITEIPDVEADDFRRAGYLEFINAPPAIKIVGKHPAGGKAVK